MAFADFYPETRDKLSQFVTTLVNSTMITQNSLKIVKALEVVETREVERNKSELKIISFFYFQE